MSNSKRLSAKDILDAKTDIDKLRYEIEFVKYIHQLIPFSTQYTVFITVLDTPCGPGFTSDIAGVLSNLGLKVNLSNKFRHAYVAIIDTGRVVIEQLAETVTQNIEHRCKLRDADIEINSTGYAGYINNADFKASIKINGKDYSANKRGLNIVVFDIEAKTLIDSVNFDTYSRKIACLHTSWYITMIKEYRQKHPEVSLLIATFPGFPTENLSDNERFIIQNSINRNNMLIYTQLIPNELNKYFNSFEEIFESIEPPRSYIGIDGIRCFEDTCGRIVNTMGGIRITTDQPKSFKRTVYTVGGCTTFGTGSADNGTIASHLQRLFNKYAPEQEIIVQNYGFYLCEDDRESYEEITILNSLPVKFGDIVICFFGDSDEDSVKVVDMKNASKRPHNYGELFFDKGHFTSNGNLLIADKIFEELKSEDFFNNVQSQSSDNVMKINDRNEKTINIGINAQMELNRYKGLLLDLYNSLFITKTNDIKIGAIVMNCNPFTLGHRYLIEQASSRVDHLFVFVVQEDKSYFSFDDRLMLVETGTADIVNLTVVPSGRFILSSLTFSEYFNKSEIKDRVIDSSLDVRLFASEIAPCLNIKVRFAGEEPHDYITRQYNNSMRSLLPQYNIEFVEIPRKEWHGQPISASAVRKFLDEDNFEEIANIVPRSTLSYLEKRFSYKSI